MLAAHRSTLLVATLAFAASAVACASSSRQLERQKCRTAFEACAPPARFDDKSDLSKLTTRNLVQLAARLDVPDKLARNAAARLKKIATAAAEPELLELESALEDTTNVLARCSCAGPFTSELEKQGIRALVKGRLPSPELRSPDVWADRIFAGVVAIRELRRSSASLLAEGGGEAGKGSAREAKMRDAERKLCISVHGARASLPPQVFATALETVNRRESDQAGEGSAAATRQTLADIQAEDTCGPEDAGAGNTSP